MLFTAKQQIENTLTNNVNNNLLKKQKKINRNIQKKLYNDFIILKEIISIDVNINIYMLRIMQITIFKYIIF